MAQWGGYEGRGGYERAWARPEGSTSSWCDMHKRKKVRTNNHAWDEMNNGYVCNVCDFLARKKGAADDPH